MRDVYGEEVSQRLDDRDWIMRASQEGWVIFSKDNGLRDRGSREFGYIRRRKSKAFLIPAGLREEEQIARYVESRFRIAMKARKRGPMVYGCLADGTLGKYYHPHA